VGVSSGAERVVHSLQRALTDPARCLSLLQVDISNAFNACDRARVLRELYRTPQLSSLYRLADFAYSAPSELLLERGDGRAIRSQNGVRQGDPLSALLFCVYMRDVLTQTAARADVQLYGFFDDLHVLGRPSEVLKAFDALRAELLPAVSLSCNTAKSHFAYFHDHAAPLLRGQREALADCDVQLHDSWLPVLGAVVGKDDEAIRDGLARTLGEQAGSAAFFRRVQSDALRCNSAMLLLRQCGVPQLNYLLRCTPPPCIAQQAEAFDEQLLRAAAVRLGWCFDQLGADALYYMQAKLRHGGLGLTPAARTSPAAYLGSLAAVGSSPEFAAHAAADCPVQPQSQLAGWLEHSVRQLVEATPSAAALLPSDATGFFHHVASTRTSARPSSSLQHQLSAQAASHQHEAFLSRCHEMRKTDGGAALAHARAVSAPRAWAWKNVVPMTQDCDLADQHYKLAARMNVRLPPVDGEHALPADCPLCDRTNGLRNDAWHFLSCARVKTREVTARHDEVVNVLYRFALMMGIQAVREPEGLQASDGRCPDLQLLLPGRHILTDVCITHPLAPSRGRASCATLAAARHYQTVKHRKYRETAAQHGAELLPFVVETCGGMASDAVQLLAAMGDMGEERLAVWPRHVVIRQLMGSVAMAVQRGNAVAVLSALSRARFVTTATACATEGVQARLGAAQAGVVEELEQ